MVYISLTLSLGLFNSCCVGNVVLPQITCVENMLLISTCTPTSTQKSKNSYTLLLKWGLRAFLYGTVVHTVLYVVALRNAVASWHSVK